MKMKKFLMLYLFFVFFLLILFAGLKLRESKSKKQEQLNVKNQKKKIVVISMLELAPIARVVRESGNSSLFFEWMSVEKAVLIMQEEIKQDNDHKFNIYLQYDNCANIY